MCSDCGSTCTKYINSKSKVKVKHNKINMCSSEGGSTYTKYLNIYQCTWMQTHLPTIYMPIKCMTHESENSKTFNKENWEILLLQWTLYSCYIFWRLYFYNSSGVYKIQNRDRFLTEQGYDTKCLELSQNLQITELLWLPFEQGACNTQLKLQANNKLIAVSAYTISIRNKTFEDKPNLRQVDIHETSFCNYYVLP